MSSLQPPIRRRALIPLCLALAGCQTSTPPDPDPAEVAGVSRELALERSRRLSDIHYRLKLKIPEDPAVRIRGEIAVRFSTTDGERPLVLDFSQPESSVLKVRVGDREVPFRAENEHIVVDGSHLRPGANEVSVEFLAGDNSLNRRQDYLYTLFVPDRASVALPCFDQPDIKASWKVELEVPTTWQAVANGPLESRQDLDGKALYSFLPTKPISTYLLAFAAGRFQIVESDVGGRRWRFFHREDDAAKVERNKDELFSLHDKALRWLEEYTGIAYPFQKFDFVLLPAFQYGGMEHPGAIFYRASSLMLEESATLGQKLGRASLIAHETAHMWFGDLVTMKWFDDVWTKEVFANFMAAKIVHPSFPDLNHELRFLLAHHPSAYRIDRTAGANPIRQPLENLKEAGSLYGPIIYQKAPIVMSHLERLLGEEELRQGLQEYLDSFRFSNASWPDLIAILDRRTSLDLQEWSQVWVEEPGRPTVRVEATYGSDSSRPITGLRMVQEDPQGKGRVWTQDLTPAAASPQGLHTASIRLDGPAADVDEMLGRSDVSYILPDVSGMGYALFKLDPASRKRLLAELSSIPNELHRAIGWLTLWDAMMEGEAAAEEMIELSLQLLSRESAELNIQQFLGGLIQLYWRWIEHPARLELSSRVESQLWKGVEESKSVSLKAAYFEAFRQVALSSSALKRLEAILSGGQAPPGLPLSQRHRTSIALTLALHEFPGWKELLQQQQRRIGNAERRERLAFIRDAVSDDLLQRRAFFEKLREAANRRREPWVLAGLRLLHHPLRAAESREFLAPSLEMLEEIQRTGDIFFPQRWLDASLAGHSSPQAAETVAAFLRERPDYPRRLRDKILQSADGLQRRARSVVR